MTGGLLQLVSKNIEDIFLTKDPNITHFKVVYRRHTSFSKEEMVLKFNKRLNFGRSSVCRILKKGDLLHNLTLKIKLNSIEAKFPKVTKQTVYDLLREEEITWSNGLINPTDTFTEDHYNNEVKNLIDDQVAIIENNIDAYEDLLDIVENEDTNVNVDTYFTSLMGKLIDEDSEWNNLHDKVKTFFTNNYTNQSVTNLLYIMTYYDEEMGEFVLKVPEDLRNDFDTNTSRMHENFDFIDKLDSSTFPNTDNLTMNNLFRNKISRLFSNEGNETYTELDAYKIFDKYFSNNTNSSATNLDTKKVKTEVLDHITFGLVKNIKMIEKIFTNLKSDFRFVFYKRYVKDSNTGTFGTGEAFNNISTTASTNVVNDKFTLEYTLDDEVNEPNNLTHFYSTHIASSITTFNTTNRNLFRGNKVASYFTDLEMWDDLKVTTYVSIADASQRAILDKVYLMNFLPRVAIDDIYTALGNADEIDENLEDFIAEKIYDSDTDSDKLTDFKETLSNTLLATYFFDDIDKANLINIYNTYSTSNNDVFLTGVFKKEQFFEIDGIEYSGMEYVVKKYQNEILSRIIDYNTDPYVTPITSTQQEILISNVIGSFGATITNVPLYSTYSKTFNLGKILNSTDFLNNPVGDIDADNKIYDAPSSIWKYLQNTLIANYNNFYHGNILSPTYITNNIGAEAKLYYDKIVTYLGDITSSGNINYYKITNAMANNALTTGAFNLAKRLTNYNAHLTHYNNNKQFLLIEFSSISKRDHLYDEIKNIKSEIETYFNNIVDNENANEDILDTIGTTVISGGSRLDGTTIDAFLGPMDILDSENNVNDLTDYIETQFAGDSDTLALYNTYIKSTSKSIYNDSDHVINHFNNFVTASDIGNYILDLIYTHSIIGAGEVNLKKSTVVLTKTAITKKLSAVKTAKENALDRIENTTTGIRKKITDWAKGNTNAKIAWINKLGHYMIKHLKLRIGGQLIDHYTGEWLELWNELTQKGGKEDNYNKMIGHVSELITFDTNAKKNYDLFIPLKFFFNIHTGLSLPLIALQHNTIEIELELEDFNKLHYIETGGEITKKPRIEGELITEYIYLDDSERKLMVNTKHEYLIENIEFDNNSLITSNDFPDEITIYDKRLFFNNPKKEIIWVFQAKSKIDGSQENGKRSFDDYTYTINNQNVFIYENAEIEFNERTREFPREAKWFECVNPRKYHSRSPRKGISVYSFALEPEKLQPTGQANMTRIDNFTIKFKIPSDILTAMENGEEFYVRVYSRGINILRIMSGMAGLAFFQP